MTNNDSRAPGFIVIQGNRLEDLGGKLAALLKAEPLPPLTAEVILVPSNGVKNWLEMTLAADAALGICAAVSLLQPGVFLCRLCRQVLGGALPRQMPFEKDSLAWRLYRAARLAAEGKEPGDPHEAALAAFEGGNFPELAGSPYLARTFDSYEDIAAELPAWAQLLYGDMTRYLRMRSDEDRAS